MSAETKRSGVESCPGTEAGCDLSTSDPELLVIRSTFSAAAMAATLSSFLALPAAAQTQWTVDDDGPADFADLQLAIDTAAAGDRLLIQPGVYGSALLDKRLSLLGDPSEPRPRISGLEIDGAERFDLTHIEFDTLSVNSVPGRSQIDDCWQNPFFSAFDTVFFREVGELVVQGTDFSSLAVAGQAPDRIQVSGNSRLVFSDCRLIGGNGVVLTSSTEPGRGGNALTVMDTSYVTLAGCDVRGGNGESLPGLFLPIGGSGGHGVELRDDAEADVRGSSFHDIEGGEGDIGGLGFDTDGYSLVNFGTGPLRRSGVTLVNAEGPNVTWVFPPSPYLFLVGDSIPGGSKRLNFYGENGTPGLVFTSLESALLELPILFGIEAWIDTTQLFQILPFTMQGQDTPVTHSWVLPPDPLLAGLALHVQGATQAFGPEGFVGANPATIVLSF